MDKLPNELVWMVGERLTRQSLARFSCTSRAYRQKLEPLLYRLHAFPEDTRAQSTVFWAMGIADPNNPETRTTILTILDKVARFCRPGSAALDRCRRPNFRRGWLELDRAARVALPYMAWVPLMHSPSLSPLHMAVLKGLDDIAAWLVAQGASVDMPIPRSEITALCLAVLGNRISIALLLLANGADPDLPLKGHARGTPTIVHMACALGHAELTEQLLASQHMEKDPTELLAFYQLRCPSDAPELVRVLVRHGADVSDNLFRDILRAPKWLSARELLGSPTFSDHLTASRASSMLQIVLSSCRGRQTTNHAETIAHMLRHLLDLGADPDLGRCLWPRLVGLGYPTMLYFLPLLLEAGMDVRPAPKTRKRKLPAKYEIDDLLGDTSPYDESQDDEGAAAQLAVVRLLLQHGAPIGGATRGDALDSYPLVPGKYHGRVGWSYRLCHVLLDHCHSIPEDRRGEDINLFLGRFAGIQRRERGVLLDGL